MEMRMENNIFERLSSYNILGCFELTQNQEKHRSYRTQNVLTPLCTFSFAYLLDTKGYIIHKAISSPFLPSDSEQLSVE